MQRYLELFLITTTLSQALRAAPATRKHRGKTLEASIHALLEVFFRNKMGSGISAGVGWVPYPNNMNSYCAIANNVLIPGRIYVKGNGHVGKRDLKIKRYLDEK